MRYLPLLALLLSLPGHADPESAPNPNRTSVTFDPTPVEQGLTFDRTHAKAVPVTLHGSTIDAWVAHPGSEPNSTNQSRFRLRVTDPRFQNGSMPVTDVEVTYYAPGERSVEFKADTARGSVVIGTGRGRGTDFVTVKFPLQDAVFGEPKIEIGSKPGFDLSVSTDNGDIYLRSVRLTGYDRENNVDWSHMLRIDQVSSSTPGGVLIYPQGSPALVHFSLKNDALIDRPLRYHFQITDYQDRVVFPGDGKVTVPANSAYDLAIPFTPKGWPLGPYEAELDLFLDDGSNTRILSRKLELGVIDDKVLEKARPGEFLYGLDPANNNEFFTHTPGPMAFYRLMGVDILRNLREKGIDVTPDNLGVCLADLAKENVHSALIIDPPRDLTPETRAKDLATVDAYLRELARRYAGTGPGKIHYFELGNEPDLPFFFPGSMAEYLECFYSMRQAIKDGAKMSGLSDKDTSVSNGGLSFVHADGVQRSRELLGLVDPTKIDAIAYHGHGPGIAPERNAWERVHQTLLAAGKAGLPQIETESGVMATDREGGIVQARTVIEKMVYAQSKGAPTFMFFRLFMEGGEAGYGMTQNLVEPRPSVLSYRTLVERLRHFRYIKSVDFAEKTKGSDADGFVFAEQDEKGVLTGRKAVVIFCEKPHRSDVRVKMAATDATITDATVYDMFNNASAATNLISNVAPLHVGPDPVFLTWTSATSPDDVQAAQAPLQVAAMEPLLDGSSTTAQFSLSNPTQKPVPVSMTIETTARVPLTADPAKNDFTLPTGQAIEVPVTLKLGKVDQVLRLPKYWRIFIDADPAGAATLHSVPATLPGKGGTIAAQSAWCPDGRIDFAKIAGGFTISRPAVACAYLDSPRAMDLACSASADWWMVWYVNGQKVCDTLAAGNQGTDHPFTLPLKAGRNVLSVAVLAGKLGWGLDINGPRERAVLEGNDPDHLLVTVTGNGQTLAQETVPVELESSLPVMGTDGSPSALDTWLPLEPLIIEGSSDVKNLWYQDPERTKWYQGEKDLSASAWLRDDGKDLRFFVAVNDDRLVQAATPADLDKSDSLRVVLADEGGKPELDLTCGLVANRTATAGRAAGATCSVERKEDTGQTLYLMTIPKSVAGTSPFRLSFSVRDNDAGYLKQTIDYGDVTKPRDGVRLRCP